MSEQSISIEEQQTRAQGLTRHGTNPLAINGALAHDVGAKVDYALASSDVKAFVAYLNLDRFRTRALAQVLAPTAALLLLGVFLEVQGRLVVDWWRLVGIGLAGSAIWATVLFYSMRAAVRIVLSMNDDGVRVVSLTETGVRETSTTVESNIAWQRVKDVIEARNLLVFNCSGASPVARDIIIPRRAFHNEAAYVAFRDRAKELWTKFNPSLLR